MSGVRFPSPGFDRNRFREKLSKAGLGGFLITSPENVYYVTGYPAIPSAGNPILFALKNVLPFFAYLDPQSNVTLFCWGGATTGIDYDADKIISFSSMSEAVSGLKDFLKLQKGDVHTLGIESSCPYFVSKIAEDVLGVHDLRAADELLQSIRLIKSPTEIGYIENSTKIVETTVSELMDLVRVGVRRPYLIHEAKTRMMAHGATGIGHITISFGTSNPEVEIDEVLETGKLVVLDLGAQYQGYASDNRRLMYTGKVPNGMIDLYKRMCGIVDEIAAQFTPGKNFNEIYHLAIGLYKKNKLEPFIPNVGHTIGLNTEEDWIYKDNPAVIQAGMVVNLELYSLYETGELIGDEETYIVGESGVTQITTLPRVIREA
jgi:Xaa-Pro aminopeptidase